MREISKAKRVNNCQAAVLFAVLILVLSGCSTYRSGFSCGEAKGANCLSMDKVDGLISSVEIERFNDSRNLSKCKGSKCKKHVVGGSNQEEMLLLKQEDAGTQVYHLEQRD